MGRKGERLQLVGFTSNGGRISHGTGWDIGYVWSSADLAHETTIQAAPRHVTQVLLWAGRDGCAAVSRRTPGRRPGLRRGCAAGAVAGRSCIRGDHRSRRVPAGAGHRRSPAAAGAAAGPAAGSGETVSVVADLS